MTATDFAHESVLLEAALQGLAIQEAGIYVDATFGRGGHSRALLSQLGPQGQLLGLDQDPQAITTGLKLAQADSRFQIIHSNFHDITQVLSELGWLGKVNGILFDLGVSSPQLDDPERGFSFLRDGPLDMRMNPLQGISAADWINRAQASDIADVLYQYGEERYSRRIARAIVYQRGQQPILRTAVLAEIIKTAHPAWERHKHPATRSFQAIRIYINRELEGLEETLAQMPQILAQGGRLAVISFHSLEDRIVKRYLREQSRGAQFPPGVPVTEAQINQTRLFKTLGKAIRPSPQEVQQNPRARSATLRVAQRL
ncbi:16S rRNA (cytosine(1402)-N(4))-methyltransferase RsmH [Candidatus Venteria ishoeyi]|uniref:16S rRNA (cytosine(1402)-N(4))-methyltransferase RsmH n=1 Tax=Candidatus Venteria ishoeyi TaxID=1899563 RepID=UPI0025A649A0|nr:16S rRNA (cytosine(1402)-N(4))-methyltransferase RsmH [Candidatus Venteria ishoeyi]MDM8545849.1 16S rRNA (cytosine(1402)-N(4))-methyltransferase RsmH [Candidatus Venteria ishoeyi]